MHTLVTPDLARRIVLDNVELLSHEAISHAQVLGRTLAQDIVSSVELPPFDNSAMDGYALRAVDIEKAPIKLQVIETIAAGNFPQNEITSGTCARIMTGAPIPSGADAVVMREDTRESQNEVEILTVVPPGTHIRRAGSDVAQEETVLRAGSLIRAAEWGMLASLGQEKVAVGRRPRLAIVTTGDELVKPGMPLKPGQIYESNSYCLEGLARSCGATIIAKHQVGDGVGQLASLLRALAVQCDAIITSGGVSAGDFDPVRDVLQEYAQVYFWKIAMKPGKPVMFASLPGYDGSAQQYPPIPIFGLPGNPVSVMVAFEQFVRPALLKMQGRRALHRPTLQAKLSGPLRSPQGKTEFVRALVLPDGEGTSNGWTAHLTGDQGSGRLSTMTRANALLVVPEGTTHLETGQMVPAQMTDWPEID